MRNFLKQTLATVLGLFIFCGLGLGGLVALILFAAREDKAPTVADQSVLVFDLSMDIRDTAPGLQPDQVVRQSLFSSGEGSSRVIALRTVVKTLEDASRDPKIVALYLQGNSDEPSTGYANLKEVRAALERFRATGKPIYAYDSSWGEREYYLGSVANHLMLNPFGVVEINGLSSETLFLAGALQKYGVGVQVTRVGKYKAAVEPFLLTKNSPENRQQTQLLLNDLWGDWLKTTGQYRKLKPTQLQAIADNQATLLAQEALKNRLIDQIASEDDVVATLKKLTGSDAEDESFRKVSLKSYAKITQDQATTTDAKAKPEIAVVYAEGEIVPGEGTDDQVGADTLASQIQELRQDDNVKAIVLRINSPGGSATAADLIQQQLLLARKAKPLIVSMGNVAASGGYWIATDAQRIVAEPTTITGSIGVFGLLPNVQTLANRQGVTWDVVKTGRYADSETLSRPKTVQELAINQKVVDWIYDQFLDRIVSSRKLDKNKVAAIAQGRVWSGVAAKRLGLVDELGGLQRAIAIAAQEAKLGNNWQVEEYPKLPDFRERLLQELLDNAKLTQTKTPVPEAFSSEFQTLNQTLSLLRLTSDPQGVYARLPYILNIR